MNVFKVADGVVDTGAGTLAAWLLSMGLLPK